VVSRPIRGNAPTIDLVLGYHRANASPILKLFLSKIDALIRRVTEKGKRKREA
jgi:LysR family transcriptional regulator, hca operon transcriptional activator